MGRAFGSLVKVADPALAAELQAILAPLKVKVEHVDTPLAVTPWLNLHAGPTGPNPPTLAQERAMWQALSEVYVGRLDYGPDAEFDMTTDLPGWATPAVLWAVETEQEVGGDLYIFRDRAGLELFKAKPDWSDPESTLEFVWVFFDVPDNVGLDQLRAVLRGLPHLAQAVVQTIAVVPGVTEDRRQLDATETALVELVAQGVQAWCLSHGMGVFTAHIHSEACHHEHSEVVTVPGTTATIAMVTEVGCDHDEPAMAPGWLLGLRCEVVNGEPQLALLVPTDRGDETVKLLEGVDGLMVRGNPQAPNEALLCGLVADHGPLVLGEVQEPPILSEAWILAAVGAEWLVEVIVVAVSDGDAPVVVAELPVVGTRLMPVAWTLGLSG